MTRPGALRLIPPEPTPARGVPPLVSTAPPRNDAWLPPRGHRRVALVALVLAGAGVLARFLPAPDAASTEVAGAREVTAYELVAGETLSFSLPPGAAELRVLTNLDLEATAPAEGLPYSVRVRIPEEGRDDTFALLALPAQDAAGARTAFFLGRPQSPARTRMLALVRPSSLPATLEVTLATPAAARASLRVLVAHALLGARSAPPPRNPGAAGLTADELAPEARAAFESRSWSRLASRTRTDSRGFYVVGGPVAPAAPRAEGELIGDGHVAAFTVTGPGTLHLEAPEGLDGEATLLDGRGVARAQPLALGPGGRISLPIAKGLSTLRVTSRRPGRIRVSGEARMAVRDEQRAGDPRDEVELKPGWSWQALSLAGPEGPPVELAVAGRGEAPLRLSARLLLGATAVAAPPVPLSWRFVDGRGAVLQHGQIAVAGPPALEDRLDGPDSFVSAPTVAFLWAPRGAERLLLAAVRPVAVSLSSPALESPLAPADQRGIDRSLVLRHADSAAFEAVRPLNQARLRALGRTVRFAGAVRLEPRPPARPVSEEATSLGPDRGGAQFVLLAPLEQAASGHREGLSFVVRPGRDETMSVARPRGASRRARVAATVHYEVEEAHGRRSLTVSVDGQVVRRASVMGRRGQIVLPPLPVGRHRLRVELPPGGRVFLDQPVVGAAAYRRSRVFTLLRGGAVVRLPKGAAARSLGVVLYADGPGRQRDAALEAIVDGGVRARRSAGASSDYTRLVRRIPLSFEKVEGARYLNRGRGGVWASAPVFIPLGDDLRPGAHRVTLRTVGLGAAPLARFFSYGGPVASRISQHLELRAEDDQ